MLFLPGNVSELAALLMAENAKGKGEVQRSTDRPTENHMDLRSLSYTTGTDS